MDHVTARLQRLWAHPRFVPTYLAFALLLGTLLVHTDHWLSTRTDEDDYVTHGFGDLLAGRNPYTTYRAADRTLDPTCSTHEKGVCWYALPYLPLTLLLHLPLLDYRWTALLAYLLLALAVRDKPWAFLAFANPFSLILAASGFTDFVVLALIAWSVRLRRQSLAWLAAATKQFALPLLLPYYAWRREWTKAAATLAFTILILLPFLLLDPHAVYYWTIHVHITGGDHKWWGLLGIGHANYLLYYALAFLLLYPDAKAARDARAKTARAARIAPEA